MAHSIAGFSCLPITSHVSQGEDAELGVGSYSKVWKGCDRRTKKDWYLLCVSLSCAKCVRDWSVHDLKLP